MAVLVVRLPVVLIRKKAAQPAHATDAAIEAPIVVCAVFNAFWFVYLATVLAAGQLIHGTLGGFSTLEKTMSQLSIKLGYWSSVLFTIVFVVYGVGVVSMAFFFPLPPWTTLADFIATAQPASLVAYALIQMAAFLSMPFAVVLFCSFHDYAPDDKKILSRVALCALIAAMVLGDQMYFVHFSAARQSISEGILKGLEQFVEWNPDSVIMASGTLGWTFFYGLAFLFVAPVFPGRGLEQGLRYASLICGSCGILGWVGTLLGSTALGLVYMMGGTLSVITIAVLASILFKRLEKGELLGSRRAA